MILKSDKDITVYYNLKHLQWSLTTSTDKNNTFADKSEVSPYEYLLNPQVFFIILKTNYPQPYAKKS